MKSVFNFLIKPKSGRTTSKKEVDGKELLLNTDLQNHQYTSRHGVIVSTPTAFETELCEGDEVIVHHNVFRTFRDIRGKEKNSKSYISDGLFTVSIDQIFAYKRIDEWHAIDGYCFVKPLKNDTAFSTDKERPLQGVVKYGNREIKKGSLVGFMPGSEYEFNIDGQRLYRVHTNRITVQYEYQGNEEEYNPSWSQGS